jgi:hypothetical protein
MGARPQDMVLVEVTEEEILLVADIVRGQVGTHEGDSGFGFRRVVNRINTEREIVRGNET